MIGGGAAPQKFDYVPKLADATISDYIIIPKGTKGASAIELLIPDPNSGFHVIPENKGNVAYYERINEDDE